MIERMAVLLQIPLTGRGPSYTCGLLAREMTTKELAVTIVTPRYRAFPVSPAEVIEVLPRWTRYIPYHWLRSVAGAKLESAFLSFRHQSRIADSRSLYFSRRSVGNNYAAKTSRHYSVSRDDQLSSRYCEDHP